MITFPVIDPVAFSIGPLSVQWYGLMYLAGLLFGIWWCRRVAERPDSGWKTEEVSDLLFNVFLGVILGGRIGYTFFYQFERLLSDPLYLFRIWEGGMSFHGGLIGVLVVFWLYARKTNRGYFEVSDFVAPVIPFGLATGRIGNFINDELWGRVSDVPWAVMFPSGGYLPRHPSQLYEAALEGVVLLLVLIWMQKRRTPTGAISGMFLLGYGVFRIAVEFFRVRDAHLQDGIFEIISMGQILSLPMVILGGLMLWGAYQRPKGLNWRNSNVVSE